MWDNKKNYDSDLPSSRAAPNHLPTVIFSLLGSRYVSKTEMISYLS